MTNDRKDRHVLAAAVHTGAQAIVTFNRKHFDSVSVGPFNIEVLSADEFLTRQLRLNPRLVLAKLVEQAAGVDRAPHRILDSLGPVAPRFASLARSRF